MSDHAIFALGVFVTLLLAGGAIFTIIEMNRMSESFTDPADRLILEPSRSSTKGTESSIP